METPIILEIHNEAEDFLRKYCPTPTKAIDNIADIAKGSASPKYIIARRLNSEKATVSYFVDWKRSKENPNEGVPIWAYDVKFAKQFDADENLLRGHMLVLRHLNEPVYSVRAPY